jgi:hypothetical protein
MEARRYCTLFDANYVVRAVALHESLRRHGGAFTLDALCFDDAAADAVMALDLPGFTATSVAALEAADPPLAATRANRSRVEYYFTCTASWVLYLLREHPEWGQVTYLDADLLFFADPAVIFEEMGSADVLIVPHRFPANRIQMEAYGRYNVGLLSFRRSASGQACLEWWRARCIEWCHDRVEENRFADQKYLDEWPERFAGVHVLQNPGAGLGPWNVRGHAVTVEDDAISVDGVPLVFYHYHGFRTLQPWLVDVGGRMPRRVRRLLGGAYARALLAARSMVGEACGVAAPAYAPTARAVLQAASLPGLLLRRRLLLVPEAFLGRAP